MNEPATFDRRREEYNTWMEQARENRRREYLKMSTEDIELNLPFAGSIAKEIMEEILEERKANGQTCEQSCLAELRGVLARLDANG